MISKFAKNALLLFGFLTVGLISQSCQEDLRAKIQKDSKAFSENHCPSRIDQATTLDSVVFRNDDSDEFIHYYTLVATDEIVDYLVSNKEELIRKMAINAHSRPYLNDVIKSKLTIVHVYRHYQTGKEIVRLNITPEDYEQYKTN